MSLFDVSFTPQSLAEIARMAGIYTLMQPAIQQAMERGTDIMVKASQGNMDWKNPTGRLEASMGKLAESPYTILFGSGLPYARRREKGFNGADSLGRVYHDPGAYFTTNAILNSEEQVLQLLSNAVMGLLSVEAKYS